MIDPPKFNISFSCPPYKKVHIAAVCVHVVSMNVVSLPANKRMHAERLCMSKVYISSVCPQTSMNKWMHAERLCMS